MMNNIIHDNAYGILGLLPNASQKELSRRLKEIEKYISIEELPSYPFDYDTYYKERSLQTVHNAFLNISNVNIQLLHHFFRVYANSEKQLEVLNNIEKEFSYENIVNIYKSINKNNFIFDKNIAITITLLIMSEHCENIDEIITFCVDMWYSIIYDEKYIKDFKKIFLLDDEIGIDETILDNLEEKLVVELTKVFSDISQQYDNNQILSMFIDKFGLNNNIFNIDTVEEIYSDIQKNIEIMDSMDISADGVFDNQEKALLKNCLNAFQENFNKLIDLGLYDNEKTVILRDLVATKIRIQILDLFNNLDEDEMALNLMKFAIYVVGTEGLKDKLSNELEILEKYNLPIDTINVGKNNTVTVYNKYLDINHRRIEFDDIQSVAYLLHTTRTNGIETERTYNFELGIEDELFVLTQNLGWFSNKKQAEEIFYKLINIATFVIPIMAEKFYASLYSGNILRIGKLYITKDNYYIRKWNGDKIVRFNGRLKIPSVKEGNVILYDEQGFSFYEVSLNYSNAPVLIELIKMLRDKNVDLSKINNGYTVKENYGLHIFHPENETDWDRKWILFCDFLGDLFSWLFLIAIGCGILWFIIGLFKG